MARFKKQDCQRNSLYVDTKVQGALARRVIFHFVMFVVVGATVGLFLQFLSDPFKPMRMHLRAFWSQSGPYVIAMLCMMPVFIKDTIALTHRMAGPIIRLRHHIRSLARGEEVDDLRFREGDFFSDLPPLFNDMVTTLQSEKPNDVSALVEAAAQVIETPEADSETADETPTAASAT